MPIKEFINKERCKQSVYPNDRWGAYHPHQCCKRVWKDEFCKTHHPESVEARQQKSERRWKEKHERDPLTIALKTVDQLKKENELLKKQIILLKENK